MVVIGRENAKITHFLVLEEGLDGVPESCKFLRASYMMKIGMNHGQSTHHTLMLPFSSFPFSCPSIWEKVQVLDDVQ